MMLRLFALILIIFVFPGLLFAGPADLQVARENVQDYKKRANDFVKMQKDLKKKRADLGPVSRLLQRRRAQAIVFEEQRRKYVVEKKRIRRTGDRGFAKDLAEKQAFDRDRSKNLDDYVVGLKTIRTAVEKFRLKVNEMTEAGLPKDFN